MPAPIKRDIKRAIVAEADLQDCYRRLAVQTGNPRVKAVLRDLLLMEEMNEVLLRSLNQSLEP